MAPAASSGKRKQTQLQGREADVILLADWDSSELLNGVGNFNGLQRFCLYRHHRGKLKACNSRFGSPLTCYLCISLKHLWKDFTASEEGGA